MEEKRNYAALDWVFGEIGETLKEARQVLEAYVEDTNDATRIRFCLAHIHQVYGSLQIVEFHGASLLAEEMEKLAEAIMNGQVSAASEAHEVLMRSLLQLPIYLEHVKNQRDDHPGVVLPLLNDLRAVRRQSYLSETNLFSPDLTAAEQITGKPHALTTRPDQLEPVLKKLRQMYQYAAASVLRGIKVDDNLAYIEKVIHRLLALTQGTRSHPLWEVAAALIEGLRRDDIELSVAVKGLLRFLAREMRVLMEKSPAALNNPPQEPLLKNLLYYVARADEGGTRIANIKERYSLATALLDGAGSEHSPGDDIISAPEPEAVRSVVVALQEELNSIKLSLDLSLSGQGSIDDLVNILPIFKRVADTLAVLGIGDLRKQVFEQAEKLERMCEVGSTDDDELMQVAGRVIEIEHNLEAIAQGATRNRDLSTVDQRNIQIDQAKSKVIKECRNGLEEAKDAIVEYISSQWNIDHLARVTQSLSEVRGGLEMVPLRQAAAVLHSCTSFISEKLLASREAPDWQSLDTLADAIASVDYYLERLEENSGDEVGDLLNVAESSIATLGYPTNYSATVEAEVDSGDSAQQQVAEVDTLPQMDVADTPSYLTEDSNTQASASAAEEYFTPSAELGSEVEEAFDNEPTESLPEEAPDLSSTSQEVHEESDIDEEIIEIFIEEAGEVGEVLAENFPLWKENTKNHDALVLVRRAFHTLKGSGRMVEAVDVGELAWAVENMLNRVIDRAITPTAVLTNLVEHVLVVLPILVEAFKNRQANPESQLTQQYIEWATQLADGKPAPKELENLSPVNAAGAVEEESVSAQVQEPEENEDQVLWEIFASEAAYHLATVENFISEMERAAPLYTPPSDDIQRALHTLKGSAHMAHVTDIASLATPLERFAKELRAYQVNINDDILQLVRDAVAYIREGLAQIHSGKPVMLSKLEQFLARTTELRELSVGHLIRATEGHQDGHKQVDPRLLSIFMAEEMRLLLDAEKILDHWQQEPDNHNEIHPLTAELSTLATGAQQANLGDMEALSKSLQQVYQKVIAGDLFCNEATVNTLKNGHEYLLDMVDSVAAGQNIPSLSPTLQNELDTLCAAVAESIDEPVIEEPGEVEEESLSPVDDTADLGLPEVDSQGEVSDVASDSDIIEVDYNQPLTNEDIEIVSDEESLEIEGEALEHIELGEPHDIGGDTTSADVEVEDAEEEDIELAEIAPEPSDLELGGEDVTTLTTTLDETPREEDELPLVNVQEEEPASLADITLSEQPGQSTFEVPEQRATGEDMDDHDREILEIFLEEADELIEELDEAIHDWESDWSNADSVEAITRALHTLKGGARLSGLSALGQLTHEYESYLIGVDEASIDDGFFSKIHHYQDNVLQAVQGAKAYLEGGSASPESESKPTSEIVKEPEPAVEDIAEVVEDKPAEIESDIPDTQEPVEIEEEVAERVEADIQAEQSTPDNVLPFAPKPKDIEPKDTEPQGGGMVSTSSPVGPVFKMPLAHGGQQSSAQVAQRRGAPQEVVKIASDLLEELVNLAGETSISRGRLEQHISDMGGAIDEIDGTLSRLQEQLRRLDIETEAQVLFRQEQLGDQEEFDPLEMDRYSQLQQLSRSLIESASDLVDLKTTLTDRIKDTETLLLQQSRINTNLQEGLMRSRMVPFSRLVPRLRRIVRQVAAELGKKVSFELDNVEGELDRSVLERMVAPLEHMLRNAVDHGIEPADQRQQAGKPETGRIVLSLGREGGDVLLRLIDDGRGIDLDRVKEKAIERGLMSDGAALSNHEIMQFILQAGFSTAENVTQISGRGVGMDVVAAEIKQLGGNMSINSEWGKGTEFNIRLPFTVSVNRALMIELGQEHYAIPLNTIEGIVRVSPFELEHYYTNPEARFEYAGENYEVRYLGNMIKSNAHLNLDSHTLPLPVLLVRSAQHTMAIQVDGLMGSREIVVKTLGQQFSAVQGISGATVMGDGSVVIILDLHALVRKDFALAAPVATQQLEQQAQPETEEDRVTQVMVVDDSVTVRKVMTRFLEREGFEVITAKDGVDALRILQDIVPDIMLLDIEMPRMDGFEVAKNVRTTSRWKHLPIIMITSRTGSKHRERALDLGVNKYLGKPYQEEELLQGIQELTNLDNGN